MVIRIFPSTNYDVELKPTCNLLICTDHHRASAGCSLLLKSPQITKFAAERKEKIAGLVEQLRSYEGSEDEVGGGAQSDWGAINKILIFEGRKNMLDVGSVNGRNCLLFPLIVIALNHQSCRPTDRSEKKGTNRIYLVGYNFIICLLMVFYCQQMRKKYFWKVELPREEKCEKQ